MCGGRIFELRDRAGSEKHFGRKTGLLCRESKYSLVQMNTDIQKEMRNTKNNVNLVGSSDMQFSIHMWMLLMYNYM